MKTGRKLIIFMILVTGMAIFPVEPIISIIGIYMMYAGFILMAICIRRLVQLNKEPDEPGPG